LEGEEALFQSQVACGSRERRPLFDLGFGSGMTRPDGLMDGAGEALKCPGLG
jgi:hypothetical protein